MNGNADTCSECGSLDLELYPGESEGEPDVDHCHDCGHDRRIL